MFFYFDIKSVTGKIIRVNPKMATLAIMVVGNKPCKDDFQGIIRYELYID